MTEQVSAIEKTLEQTIKAITKQDVPALQEWVKKFEERNPGVPKDVLAKRLITREARRSGMVGGLTGLGGLATLPIAIPVDVGMNLRMVAHVTYSIALLYGQEPDEIDLYIVLGGQAVREALEQAGIMIGKDMTQRLVNKYVTREVMKKINRIVSRKIITKAGEKSAFSFTKMVPVVGAPIGYTINHRAMKITGNKALKHYQLAA